MVEENIRLVNREGGDLWLEKTGDQGWYRFCSSRDEYFLKFARLVFDEYPDHPYALDPPGGPFLAIGHVFDGIGRVTGIKSTGKGIYIKIE